MLIDDFMPDFEFGDSQKTDVKASPDAVFRAVKTFDMAESTTIRWLFKMRGIPTNNLTLRDLERVNFKVLGEKQNEELVLGLAGEFKTLMGGLLNLSPEQFSAFNNPGFIKACWNFAVSDIGNGKTRVITEIRIHGTDSASVAKVKNFWGMLKTPSAMIRNEILKLIRKEAERRSGEK
jgi:hypothetical protein